MQYVTIIRGNGLPLTVSAACAKRGSCPMSGCDCPTQWCIWCQNEIRWSTSYDIPHYVHTTAAATLACPGLATGQDVTPA